MIACEQSHHPHSSGTNHDNEMEIMEEMIQPMMLDDHMDDDDHDPMNEVADDDDSHENRNKRSKSSNDLTTHSRLLDSHIKIALSLYKVQQNIYLLDFQRIEVVFYCHCICLLICCEGRCLWFYETLRFYHHRTKELIRCIKI